MELADKLKLLPGQPGVYLMKNAADEIIYVGKAKNLRNRVRSYFQSARHHGAKVKALVEHIVDFEYIITDSEVEALILESNLIKEHSPWYNVRLKDDKNYPYIKLTINEPFPRVFMVRRKLKDGARYFGPFTDADAVRQTVNFLRKLFPIRSCRKDIQEGQSDRPCLNYHIGRCLAPCAGLISRQEYGKLIDEVLLFLEGRHDRLIPDLEKKMAEASIRLEFEKAGRLRDQIAALTKIVEKQKIVSDHGKDQDVLGYYRVGDIAVVQVFFVRNGKLIGRDHFLLDCKIDEEGPEILGSFLKQYYSEATLFPKELLLPFTPEDMEVIAEWLTTLKGSKVYLRVPQRGANKRLSEMVTENARLVLEEIRSKEDRKAKEIEQGLAELQDALALTNHLTRMECYDISNTQGSQIVASMVVMVDGIPANDQYRRFKIKTVEDGPNDFLAMQEVLRRRFMRGLKEQSGEEPGDKFATFPDLVIVDGGKGQLSAALEVRDELGLNIPFVGLAKKFEELFVPEQKAPIILPRQSQGLLMLQRIRDEAHRFAISYHRQLRGRASIGSILDEIPGVGPKRKKALLRHFGTVKKIREASIAELMEVEGINNKVAEEIYQYVRKT